MLAPYGVGIFNRNYSSHLLEATQFISLSGLYNVETMTLFIIFRYYDRHLIFIQN